ncbi:hypothetical protein ABI59_22355 [Acidobacteria bacterium Mor1]|nr:hypothetical protein ABI59_22355 [Acidobacteria bacterium Mor1]
MTLPSRFCAHCHCNNCRRAHGAAFVTWIGFQNDQVRISCGTELVQRYRTDTDATRTFCSRCGTTLFYEGPRWKGEIHVVLANVDTPVDRKPAANVYVDHRAPWWEITDDLPRYGGESGTEKQ